MRPKHWAPRTRVLYGHPQGLNCGIAHTQCGPGPFSTGGRRKTTAFMVFAFYAAEQGALIGI